MICVNSAILDTYERSSYAASCRAEREAEAHIESQCDEFREFLKSGFDTAVLAVALASAMQKDKEASRIYGYAGLDYAGERRALDALSGDAFARYYQKSDAVVVSKDYCDRAVATLWFEDYGCSHDDVDRQEIIAHLIDVIKEECAE